MHHSKNDVLVTRSNQGPVVKHCPAIATRRFREETRAHKNCSWGKNNKISRVAGMICRFIRPKTILPFVSLTQIRFCSFTLNLFSSGPIHSSPDRQILGTAWETRASVFRPGPSLCLTSSTPVARSAARHVNREDL